MKKQDKITTVENLIQQLKEAKSIILTDYRGLSVTQMTQLRSQVKKSGGELMVIKNTLLARALSELGLTIPDEGLEGPTAVLITTGADELAPIKTVASFTKINTLPSFKSGVWEDRILTKEEIERLSVLPGKDELMAQLTGVIATPAIKLVQIITNNPKKLIILLKQLQAKMEGGSAHPKHD
ncbi:MAG: 50S ribosomal protein L10 [bacterium]|nr:50S ribosomal protein L10 [bacterium]